MADWLKLGLQILFVLPIIIGVDYLGYYGLAHSPLDSTEVLIGQAVFVVLATRLLIAEDRIKKLENNEALAK